MPAKRIGSYLVDREIGAGGMAAVHLGRLVGAGGFGRPVAIKRLHRHLARDTDFREMFLDEARIAARVVHPNVVSTLDFVSHGDELLLVMELVRGVSLSQILATCARRGEHVPVPVACTIAAGMLAGLRAAHQSTDDAGAPLALVHRDVSPHNVLVDVDGVVKVVDFGIARARGRARETGHGELKGKLGYMPPEQLRGEALDARADVYAVGVVLWEMLVGRALRSGDAASVLYDALERVPAPASAANPDVSTALDAVVARALARDRADRFTDAGEMEEALAAAVALVQRRDVARWVASHEAEALDRLAGWLDVLDASTLEASADTAEQAPPVTEPAQVSEIASGAEVLAARLPPPGGETERIAPPPPTGRTGRRLLGVAIAIAVAGALGAALWVRRGATELRSPRPDPTVEQNAASACGGAGEACCGATCDGEFLSCQAGRCTGCADRIFGGDASASTCARLRGGDVYCWGSNEDLLFGLKAYTRATRPFLLEGVRAPSHLVLSEAVALVVIDGRLYGWGDPSEGVLGKVANIQERFEPSHLRDLGLGDVTAIGIHGGGASSGSACAIAGGKVHCWGMNSSGISGRWTADEPFLRHEPVNQVPLVADEHASVLALGRDTPPCIESDRGTTCWRHPSMQTAVPVPDEAKDDHATMAVARVQGTPFAGGTTGCLLRDGRPFCWGFNIHCELGARWVDDRFSPRDPFEGMKAELTTLSLGDGHVCAIDRRGRLLCWGANAMGQAGHDPQLQLLCDPTAVPLEAAAVQVVAGSDHTCVLDEHGVVWCFGSDQFGQLGTGTRTEPLHRARPMPVALPCASPTR